MKYLIYAMPRSGSAWLANFLTFGESFCFHEPLAQGMVDLPAVAPIVGAVDTGAFYIEGEGLHADRHFRLVRNASDVRRSLRRLRLPVAGVAQFSADTAHLETLEYERLFDVEYLRDVWSRVVGTTFHVERAQQLTETHVERDLAMLAAHVRRRYGMEK